MLLELPVTGYSFTDSFTGSILLSNFHRMYYYFRDNGGEQSWFMVWTVKEISKIVISIQIVRAESMV